MKLHNFGRQRSLELRNTGLLVKTNGDNHVLRCEGSGSGFNSVAIVASLYSEDVDAVADGKLILMDVVLKIANDLIAAQKPVRVPSWYRRAGQLRLPVGSIES